jgi:hypothetical protein
MTILKDIQNAIIAILKAGTTHALVADANIFYGAFTSRTAPLISVLWKGGPIKPVTFGQQNWTQDFHIIAIDAAPSGDTAEQSVQNIAEAIIVDLKANPTLSGKVQQCEVVAVEGDVVQGIQVSTEWGKLNQVLAGSKVTLRTTLLLQNR